eukprot:maker-scaffold82_size396747-snap-gene-2.38 protein:Tk06838 transcript:maker-scaffold82_size396747-snap-gene-2.38-mRNA-1 annotation:"PREDICTED: uncharacterized protein LOC103573335"
MWAGMTFPSLVMSPKTMILAGNLVFITGGTPDLSSDSQRSFTGLPKSSLTALITVLRPTDLLAACTFMETPGLALMDLFKPARKRGVRFLALCASIGVLLGSTMDLRAAFLFLCLFLVSRVTFAQNLATACDPDECKLPDCRCSSRIPPLEPSQIPQIVHLTFNEAVTSTSERFFQQLFYGDYQNPNGCNIRATHYVSHEYTDYSMVHTYWTRGHEIASISVTHENNITYWQLINETGWAMEMNGMRSMLENFAHIPLDDDCQIEPCVNQSYPGIWEYPILTLEDSRDVFGDGQGEPCSFFGACQGYPSPLPKFIFEMLKKNFDRVYYGNRAPFGLHAQTAFFVEPQTWMFDGYLMFVEYLTSFEDVYVVPVIDGLKYVRNPVTIEEAATFPPFMCDEFPKPKDCTAKSCRAGNLFHTAIPLSTRVLAA